MPQFLHSCLLLCLMFYLQDGNGKFLRNNSSYLCSKVRCIKYHNNKIFTLFLRLTNFFFIVVQTIHSKTDHTALSASAGTQFRICCTICGRTGFIYIGQTVRTCPRYMQLFGERKTGAPLWSWIGRLK
jgi:hypothetical protein